MTVIEVAPVIETRSEGLQVAEVDIPKRIVTCIAMPYEEPALVHERSRSYIEVVTRGAFAGIEKRIGRIRANRDHSWEKICGKLIGIYPSRQEGLVTETRMFRTELGTETLELCDDGGLDASAGFTLLRREDGRVYDDAVVWERNRTVRRLNRLWLDHLAFVPDPAYAGAKILSVRQNVAPEPPDPEATPNRDRLALQDLRTQLDELNRRWA